jgi:hypothetical protein
MDNENSVDNIKGKGYLFLVCNECGSGFWRKCVNDKILCKSCRIKLSWQNKDIRNSRVIGLQKSWDNNPELKKVFSAKYSGEGNPFYNKKHSDKSIELMSKPRTKIDIQPTHEWGYLIGLVLGDGCVYLGSHHNYKITVGSSRPEIVDKFYESANKLGLHCCYEMTDRKAEGFSKIDYIRYTAVILSKSLYLYLKPCKKPDFHFHIPDIVYKNKDIISGCLQGFYDAEGGVYKNSSVNAYSIESWSKHVSNLEQIQNLFDIIGIKSHLLKENKKQLSSRLTITDYDNRIRFKELVGFRIKRKQDILDSMKQTLSKIHSIGKYNEALLLRENGYMYKDIAKITGIPRDTITGWCLGKRPHILAIDEHYKERKVIINNLSQ